METRALRYFQAVAEYGSLQPRRRVPAHLAARRQPHRSASSKGELGASLFRRHGHGVALTEAGQVLLERSQTCCGRSNRRGRDPRRAARPRRHHRAGAAARRRGRSSRRPSSSASAPSTRTCSVKILGGFSGYIHEWLVRGQVDLACVHDPLPQRGFRGDAPRQRGGVSGRPTRSGPLSSQPWNGGSCAACRSCCRAGRTRRGACSTAWVGPPALPCASRAEVDDHTSGALSSGRASASLC